MPHLEIRQSTVKTVFTLLNRYFIPAGLICFAVLILTTGHAQHAPIPLPSTQSTHPQPANTHPTSPSTPATNTPNTTSPSTATSSVGPRRTLYTEAPQAHIWVNKARRDGRPRYAVGEDMYITVHSNHAGYVYVINVRANALAEVIYPNSYDTQNYIRAGETKVLGHTYSPYRFTVLGPSGTDYVYVVTSHQPLNPPALEKVKLECLYAARRGQSDLPLAIYNSVPGGGDTPYWIHTGISLDVQTAP